MESNPEFGVIDYRQSDTIYIDKQEIVWLAKLSDLGKPLK